MGGACSRYGGIGEVHTVIWWANMIERDSLEDPDIDGKIKLKWIFKKWDGDAWTGLICFRI